MMDIHFSYISDRLHHLPLVRKEEDMEHSPG